MLMPIKPTPGRRKGQWGVMPGDLYKLDSLSGDARKFGQPTVPKAALGKTGTFEVKKMPESLPGRDATLGPRNKAYHEMNEPRPAIIGRSEHTYTLRDRRVGERRKIGRRET